MKKNNSMNTITIFIAVMLMLMLTLIVSPAIAQTTSSSPNSQSQTDPYAYQRFTPAMAIIIVVLITALFFMVFFSIYIRQCQNPAAGTSAVPTFAGRSRRTAARGLDAAVLATFPTMEYSEVKGLKIGSKGGLECAVCICEFEDDETLRLIPKCDHVFHPECIDTWLASHTTCPVCRADLVPDPNEPVAEPVSEGLEADLTDVEAQSGVGESESEVTESERLNLDGSKRRSSRFRVVFPRSHSTGHSLVQPGEDTERFTLRLPVEVRKLMVNRQLNRASSMVLPRERSSRRGYRTGEGSSRGGGRTGKRLDRIYTFLTRMSSMKSPKVAANDDEAGSSSERIVGPDVPRSDSYRPPV